MTTLHPHIRIRKGTIYKLKEIKKQSKLKSYDNVINYLLVIRDKYFKLKNR
jgi:hypothetical protein